MPEFVEPTTTNLYTADQVRALDQAACELQGIASFELMQRAGAAAFQQLQRMLAIQQASATRVLVFCGAGNNGGDGYVVARLAQEAGMQVSLVSLVSTDKLAGDALQAAQQWQQSKGTIGSVDSVVVADHDIVVDAMLGTGLQRPLSGDFLRTIEMINAAGLPVLAIDVPSGLSADSGQAMPLAVQADATISFIGLKRGLLTGLAPDYCGQVIFDDLQVPDETYQAVQPGAQLLASTSVVAALPPRKRASHKGHFGHVLVVGGTRGMAGAPAMTGAAALRVGAGLVSIATDACHVGVAPALQAELMAHGVNEAAELDSLLSAATVVAVGPGLGQNSWSQALWAKVCDSALPLVVDADALNLLAQDPQPRGNWVLTPHPGEAARLLRCSIADVQADRFAAVQEFCSQYQAVTVLKGAGSLVADQQANSVAVCARGHPGMASAGMGDVLTGLVAGLRSQGALDLAAAQAGVWIHASAAEAVARVSGERGTLATDLLLEIKRQVNG